MKKALVFFNPKSGIVKKTQKISKVTNALQEINIETRIIKVQDYFYGHDNPRPNNYDLIVAAGGDGTIRLAANWILKNNPKLPLGVIPMGSGNLFAEAVGIPLNFKKAIKNIAKLKIKKIDVGRVNNDQYFVLSFSFGHMAEVIGRTTIKEKRKLGFWAYWKRFFFRPIKLWDFDFKVDGKDFNITGNNFFIFNAIKFMGFQPAKKFDYCDGILDAFITSNKTFFGWWISAISLVIFKKPPKQIVFTTSGKTFQIKPKQHKKINAQFDGDRVDLDSAEIKVVPSALKIILP